MVLFVSYPEEDLFPVREESHTASGRPSTAKSPDIARQVVLPFRKSLEISLKSLRVRFFRSLITTMTLVLAVAFLGFVWVSTDLADGLLRTRDPGVLQTLEQVGYEVGPGTASAGSSAKDRWIVALSLLVCVVGIVNAQLMAVTERFREIGTIKCLGALDSFVLRLFLLEAGMQGFAGGSAGAVLGGLVALMNGLLRYGFLAWTEISWMAVGRSLGLAALVGCLLSLLGVLYPAIVAARLQPVEAMRLEE
jgi:cell division protein FtsX